MNINTRLSRSNYNLNQTQTPHFHRSYHNLNAIEQQYAPPRPPALIEPTTTTTLFIQPQQQQQQQINDAYHVQQQNQWFRNNYNKNNNNNSNWNKYNAYETPNFVPASFWMGSERFVYPSMKQDSSTDVVATTWHPQQQQHQQQRGNILDYKNQSNTIYSVYNNHNGKRHKPKTTTTTNNINDNSSGTNVVATTIQPVIKVRTNVQGLPYTPQPARRNTVTAVNEQRAIQAVMPLNDILTNMRGSQTKSPNRYFESDVNIHYKAPVRNEYRPQLSEEELALRQSEHMQKLYQEERRRKYLLELQDMNARRHTDNFSPSQKSPIPLNRYDDFQADLAPKSPNFANKLKMVVRALYNFQGQNPRELSFKKGDIIYVRRQIDKNWFEGEFNAMIGLFPANYVEILSKDGANRPPITKRPSEGQARAKYNFQAQSGVELSLNKGELVALTRRVDDNWFEGRIANRKGIFPVSYVEVLTDIGAEDIAAKTVVPTFKPNLDALRTEVNNEFNKITRNGHHPPNGILKETKFEKMDVLHVETHNDPISYRALYKYRPQNSDELELFEGDIVHVLEKCDDGWFVGTSQRTGCFGTFPGNYVERV